MDYGWLFCCHPDAKLNEKIIQQLKEALNEQEATMQTQDVVIRNHEYEVTSLTKGEAYYFYTYQVSKCRIYFYTMHFCPKLTGIQR